LQDPFSLFCFSQVRYAALGPSICICLVLRAALSWRASSRQHLLTGAGALLHVDLDIGRVFRLVLLVLGFSLLASSLVSPLRDRLWAWLYDAKSKRLAIPWT